MTSLAWRDTGHPVWKYEVTEQYRHECHYKLKPGKSSAPRHETYWSIYHVENVILLREAYRWNGSNVVTDTKADMLASGIHDAQCQGMKDGIYRASLRNWERAAREYRRNCITGGMSRIRAYARYTGLLVGGGNGYKFRRILHRD